MAKFSSDLLTLASDSDDEEADVPTPLTDSESEPEDPKRAPRPTHIQRLLRAEAKRKRCEDNDDVCSLDSASQAKSSDNDGSPERPSVRSPVQQHYISHSSAPARRQPIPMDPVLQAERLKALQELEALRRPKEDELVLSQTDSEVCVPGQPQPKFEQHGVASNHGQPNGDEAEEDDEEQVEEEEKIILKVKSSKHPEGLKLRIGANQPFNRLFTGYEDLGHKAGWLPIGAKVTFKFDGDALDGDDTPKHLDMEDEDVVDACW